MDLTCRVHRIRKNFSSATVLTIAHRLHTIMDSDKILVLNHGEVIEFDTPQALLSKQNSLFKDFVGKNRNSDKNDVFSDGEDRYQNSLAGHNEDDTSLELI